MIRLDQENDITILRQAALELERENQRLIAKIVELTRELERLKGKDPGPLRRQIEKLEQQLAQRNQRLFGDSSERRTTGEDPKRGEEAPKPPQKGHGPRPQPKLP